MLLKSCTSSAGSSTYNVESKYFICKANMRNVKIKYNVHTA